MSTLETYEAIKEWKEKNIYSHLSDTISLNSFHDTVMLKVFEIAVARLSIESPPCDFCWFIAGSGGRCEQGLISDQDHGIIYQIFSDENRDYFLQLGKEISYGLSIVGYPYCKGNIMSSNPLWCKSVEEWKNQLYSWMDESSWESIRNLQIFFDSRCLYGERQYVEELKAYIFDFQEKNPFLLRRLMDNVMHIKKAISPLGQILVSKTGEHTGAIDLKYSAFIPYVNAVRILSIKEGIMEISTDNRMKRLSLMPAYKKILETSAVNFQRLLQYRLSLSQVVMYEDTHFLKVNKLNREQKKEIKRILKDGENLHHFVINLIKKGV